MLQERALPRAFFGEAIDRLVENDLVRSHVYEPGKIGPDAAIQIIACTRCHAVFGRLFSPWKIL